MPTVLVGASLGLLGTLHIVMPFALICESRAFQKGKEHMQLTDNSSYFSLRDSCGGLEHMRD